MPPFCGACSCQFAERCDYSELVSNIAKVAAILIRYAIDKAPFSYTSIALRSKYGRSIFEARTNGQNGVSKHPADIRSAARLPAERSQHNYSAMGRTYRKTIIKKIKRCVSAQCTGVHS